MITESNQDYALYRMEALRILGNKCQVCGADDGHNLFIKPKPMTPYYNLKGIIRNKKIFQLGQTVASHHFGLYCRGHRRLGNT